jgi:small ligand-binding sensory domain FIST
VLLRKAAICTGVLEPAARGSVLPLSVSLGKIMASGRIASRTTRADKRSIPGAAVGSRFRAAHASGGPWPALVKACFDQLTPLPPGATLGFLYVTDALAGDLANILAVLRERTRIANWVGSVGLGICSPGRETYECPGLTVMVAALPVDDFHVFSPVAGAQQDFSPEVRSWIARRRPSVGVVHADPRCTDIENAIASVSARSSAFLVGGVTSARRFPLQIAGRTAEGGISGVLLTQDIVVAAGLSQACSRIGPVHSITEARDNVVVAIDGRPALDVLQDEIGELLSRDMRKVPGLIFAGFPITDADSDEFLVRNLLAIDAERKRLAVRRTVATGDRILFCRRDPQNAVTDLKRMLHDIRQQSGCVPQAALYFSCVMRGANLFGPESQELGLVRAALGDIPLVGFFANGEISNSRLHEYTGALALFL